MKKPVNERLLDAVNECSLIGVKQALHKGADVHYLDDFAARWAAYKGYLEILKYLIENGANLNYKLMVEAIESGHLDTVKYLREKGLDFTGTRKAVVVAYLSDNKELIKYLREQGVEF